MERFSFLLIKIYIMDEVKNNAVAPEVADAPVDPKIEEMAKTGMLLGRKRMRTNPKMREYVFTNRNGVEIFDLEKTVDAIEKAKAALKEVAKTGKPILVVGTEPAASSVVTAFAQKFNLPYVVERWLGGTLTNFESISTRLQYYMKMKADAAAGRLDKYTKKERVVIDKEIERLTKLFGGLERLSSLPAMLIVVGAKKHEIAIAEANIKKIPVIAIANSDANPDAITYVIPANDNSRASIELILAKLESAMAAGVKVTAPSVKK